MLFTYFWSANDKDFGCFSQWYTSPFKELDGTEYKCSEQYMMAKKALLFKDVDILQKILSESDPKKIKSLGRKIKNFDQNIWDKNKFRIVLNGNILKFTQNEDILKILLSTENSIIAEASPYDKIWGIGVKKRKGLTEKDWKGENLLGQVLMEVRDLMLAQSLLTH